MNSHIDDIIGLIDSVLGPDDGGPVPADVNNYGDAHRNYGDDPYVPLGERSPFLTPDEIFGPVSLRSLQRSEASRITPMGRNRSTGGKYRVNELDNLTLAKLESHLGNRTERGLSNNTKVARDFQGNLVIILHRTAIVTYKRDVGGEVTMTLDSGGWRTTTTKQRMNAFLPHRYRIFADKGTWYIQIRSTAGDDVIDYDDGINLYTGER